MACNVVIIVVFAIARVVCQNYLQACSQEEKTKLELSLTYDSLELYPISDQEKAAPQKNKESSLMTGDL